MKPMISRYSYHGLTWIDLESPTREELLHISEEFALSKPLEEALYSKIAEAGIDAYPAYIHVILHFPQTLNFIIGKQFIITVRYELIPSLQEFAALFEHSEMADHRKKISDTGMMFMEIMVQLYKTSLKELAEITGTIPKIEQSIFAGRQQSAIKTLFQTTLKLSGFKQTINTHSGILHSYQLASRQLFGEIYEYYAMLIISTYDSLYSRIEGQQAALAELRRSNDSLLVTGTNKLMRTLCYISTIASVAIIISIFIWH